MNEIIKTIEEMKRYTPKDRVLRVFTAGTGVPDDYAINVYKDTNVIVVVRDGTEYLRGEKLKK